MTSHVYTLNELVDLALQTPSVGAVNFNILRIILQKIISECKLQNVTAEWKPFEITPVSEILEDDKLPDHPILRRIEEEKRDKKEKKVATSDKVGKPSKSASSSEEKSVQTPEFISQTEAEDTGDEAEDTEDEATDTTESKTETETSEDGASIIEETKSTEVVKKKKNKTSVATSSKGLKVGSELWQLWQIKKMAKTIEALEEEMSALIDVVDDLQEFKDSKMKTTKFEEGEKYASGYSGPVVSRHEFEDAIDGLGEALVRISIKQNQQKDACTGANKDVLEEVSLKVSSEDLAKSNEPIKKKLKTLSIAVKNIQKLIKDIIYPETCGTTKCMACNRNAHLPLRCLKMDANKKPQDIKRTSANEEESGKKKHDPEARSSLKFTNICLKRSRQEETQVHVDDKTASEIQDQKERHPERPMFPDYLVNLESFSDLSSISRNFAPLRVFPDFLRRNTVYVPAIYSNNGATTMSVGGDNSQIVLQRCSNSVK